MNKSAENTSYEELLHKKKELLGVILDIALKQQKYLDGDEVETLLKAIEERQKIIGEIESIDDYVNRAGLGTIKTAAEENLTAEVKKILQEIADADKKNIKAAEEKVEEYKGQIRSVKNNKKRISSYQNIQDTGDSIYFDKKK